MQTLQIELTSPAASEQSRADCEAICKLGLKAKVRTILSPHTEIHTNSHRFLLTSDVIWMMQESQYKPVLMECKFDYSLAELSPNMS